MFGFATFARHRHAAPAPIQHDRAASVVSVSAGLEGALAALPELLGDEFRILVDQPEGSLVSIVGPVGLPGIAFLKLLHPHPALLVVDPRWETSPERAAGYLDAGADGYVSGTSARVVAAHVRALMRWRVEPRAPTANTTSDPMAER
jgi:hypothetical protein